MAEEVDVVVVVLEVVLVGSVGSCWVAAPATAVSSKAPAANAISLVACFICVFSIPSYILSSFRLDASENRPMHRLMVRLRA